MSFEDLYQQVILDHSRMRSGMGSIEEFEATSFQVNPTCGDEVTLGLEVDEDGTITALAWEGDGCSISQASLSMMSEMLKGAKIEDVRSKYAAMYEMMHSRGQGVEDEVLDLLEDAAALEGTSKFANRVKCSLLGWYAVRDALAQLGWNVEDEGQGKDE